MIWVFFVLNDIEKIVLKKCSVYEEKSETIQI